LPGRSTTSAKVYKTLCPGAVVTSCGRGLTVGIATETTRQQQGPMKVLHRVRNSLSEFHDSFMITCTLVYYCEFVGKFFQILFLNIWPNLNLHYIPQNA